MNRLGEVARIGKAGTLVELSRFDQVVLEKPGCLPIAPPGGQLRFRQHAARAHLIDVHRGPEFSEGPSVIGDRNISAGERIQDVAAHLPEFPSSP